MKWFRARFCALLVLLTIVGAFAAIVLGVIPARSILYESRVVTSGNFGKFQIGEGKAKALSSIFEVAPTAIINPVPTLSFFVTKRNLSDISCIKSVEGIRLTNYRGAYADIFFSNGKIYKIERSFANKFPQFQIGDTKSQTIDKLLRVLESDNSFSVYPIIDYRGVRSYPVEAALRNKDSKLFDYNAWEFEVVDIRPAGAFYTLFFSDQHLKKIEYRKPRVRNDL